MNNKPCLVSLIGIALLVTVPVSADQEVTAVEECSEKNCVTYLAQTADEAYLRYEAEELNEELRTAADQRLKQVFVAALKEAQVEMNKISQTKEEKASAATALVGLAWRIPVLFFYLRHAVPEIKENYLQGKNGEAAVEVLKTVIVSWFLTKPAEDLAKPYTSAINNKIDQIATSLAKWFASWVYSFEEDKKPAQTIAAA